MFYLDHEALKHLNSQDKLSSRHAGWVAYVQQFSFLIKHKYGVLNKVANVISWKTLLLKTMKTKVLGFYFLKDALSINLFFSHVVSDVIAENRADFILYGGFIFKGNKFYISKGSLILKIIQELYNEGHMGHECMIGCSN
jgi:hypothetical protein